MNRSTIFRASVLILSLAVSTLFAVAIPNPNSFPHDTTIVLKEIMDGKVALGRLDTTVRYTRMHYPEGGGYEDFELARTPGSITDHLIFYGKFRRETVAFNNRKIEYEIAKPNRKKVYMQVTKVHVTKTWTGRHLQYRIDSLQLAFDTVSHLKDTVLYYPLAIGNCWESIGSNSFQTNYIFHQVTGDTAFNNGKAYRVIRSAYRKIPETPNPDSLRNAKFERVVGNRVYEYDIRSKREHLKYDFSCSPGDTIFWINGQIGSRPDSGMAIMISKKPLKVFGRMLTAVEFKVDPSFGSADEEYNVTIADSIGRNSSYNGWGYSTGLLRAVIDGKLYGTPPEIAQSPNLMNSPVRRSFAIHEHAGQIHFSSNKGAIGKLEVFNSLGQCVWSHHNHSRSKSLVWKPGIAPAGIYLTRAQIGPEILVRRIRNVK